MQKKGLNYYSLFATMLFVLPVILQLFKISMGFDYILSLLIYGFVILNFIYNAIDSKKRAPYVSAFKFDKSYRLDIFSYLVAIGFFVEFISNVATLVKCIIDNQPLIVMSLISLLACTIFSLLSSFYFIVVGVSYGTNDYDFRSFELYHIVTVMWATFKLITLFGQVVSFPQDVDGTLRFLSIMVIAFFFYRFAREVASGGNASHNTVFCARLTAYCSGLYCINRIMLIIAGEVELLSKDSLFALTSAFICLFGLFFEKSIIHNSYNEE